LSKKGDEFSLTNIVRYCKISKNNKERWKHIKEIKIQEWLPIDEIYKNGIIKIKKNKYIKILKIIPINYNLKSDLEKASILNSYKIFLKTCNFNIQILIQSNKEDLTQHIQNIKNNIEKKENNYLKKISQNYIDYINKINSDKKSSSKNYYLIISNQKNPEKEYIESQEIIKSELKEIYFKIKESLARCGNSVIEINNRAEIEKIIFSFLNTRKNINNLNI